MIPFSRRALVQGAAAAGGVAAASAILAALGPEARAAPTTPPALPREGRRVLVLGAGIAGLVAALELRRAGWPVTVLEAADRPGGRCRTLRAGDVVEEVDGTRQRVAWPEAPHLYFNPGPARIPHHHRAVLGYCKQLGVPLEVLVNENRAALVQSDEANGGAPLPLRRVRAGLLGTVAELAAKALPVAALDAPLTVADLDRLRAMLRGFGALDRDLRWRGASRNGWAEPPGAGPQRGRAHPPLDPRVLLEPEFWYGAGFAEGVDYAATMLQPLGGMDAIAHALAQALGDAVQYGAAVTALRRTEAGARVTLRRGAATEVLDADLVLCTLPAPVLAGLDTDFTEARQAALARLHYARACKLGWYAARRFWEEEAIYGGISWTARDVGQLWYPSHGFHTADGVLVGAYMYDGLSALRFGARTPEARAAAAATDGAALHPGFAAEVSHAVSVPWARMPHALGAWGEYTAAQRAEIYPLLCAPEGPYHFAGEHLSWLPGWQEGAVLSAWAALEGLAAAR